MPHRNVVDVRLLFVVVGVAGIVVGGVAVVAMVVEGAVLIDCDVV
jgi:hypothetical protein